MNSSRNTACSMPATGPARAGPHVGGGAGDGAGDADAAEQRRGHVGDALRHQLALERCRRPVMLSATTADSRLSMPPSSAKESAAGSTPRAWPTESAGRCGAGKRSRNAAEARADGLDRQPESRGDERPRPRPPIRKAGQCGRKRRTARMAAIVSAATAMAAALVVGSACARASSLGSSGPGSLPASVSPSRSLIWLAKMMTAMPDGEADGDRIGNILDEGAEPQQADAEQDAGRTAAVASISPSTPCCSTVAATSTMKAPAGPPIWKPAAAERRHQKAADDGGIEPAIRRDAGGDGDRHGKRQGHDGDREARDDVGLESAESVALAQDRDELGCMKLLEGGP